MPYQIYCHLQEIQVQFLHQSQKNHIVFFANGKITAQDIQIDLQNVILLCAMNIQFYIVSIVNNIN